VSARVRVLSEIANSARCSDVQFLDDGTVIYRIDTMWMTAEEYFDEPRLFDAVEPPD
jgi:hypothetical protein